MRRRAGTIKVNWAQTFATKTSPWRWKDGIGLRTSKGEWVRQWVSFESVLIELPNLSTPRRSRSEIHGCGQTTWCPLFEGPSWTSLSCPWVCCVTPLGSRRMTTPHNALNTRCLLSYEGSTDSRILNFASFPGMLPGIKFPQIQWALSKGWSGWDAPSASQKTHIQTVELASCLDKASHRRHLYHSVDTGEKLHPRRGRLCAVRKALRAAL